MIGHLTGTLLLKSLEGLIVDVRGVGYRVEVPLSTLTRLPPIGETTSLFIHTYVREDAIRLFGFESTDALRLFERLLGVAGVGPKTALQALSHLTPDALCRAIVNGDTIQLGRISGIGKKTAERIVVDLAGPLSKTDFASVNIGATLGRAGPNSLLNDLEGALRYLGYKDKEVSTVVQKLEKEAHGETTIEPLLKRALKLLQ